MKPKQVGINVVTRVTTKTHISVPEEVVRSIVARWILENKGLDVDKDALDWTFENDGDSYVITSLDCDLVIEA